jgi:hypothetical protein
MKQMTIIDRFAENLLIILKDPRHQEFTSNGSSLGSKRIK